MSEVVRLGLIGCGGFARYHMGLLKDMKEAKVVALCDPDQTQIATSKECFPDLAAVPVYSDYRALLDDPTVEAVLICSPHTGHAQQILDAFGAAKHVLVEKPLTTSVSDAHKVIQARDESGKVGAVSYQRHGQGQFQYIRENLAGGRYGKLLGLNSHLSQQWLQFTRGTWRQQKSLSGGGQINDSGSHMIDILLWCTGLRAKRVSAMMDNRGTEVDIDSIVTIEFEGGALGSLTIIGDACMWHERHQIWLENAAIILEGDDLTIIDEKGRTTKVTGWGHPVSPDQNFIDAILKGSEVLAPFECGLKTIELTEAAWRSAELGGTPIAVADIAS